MTLKKGKKEPICKTLRSGRRLILNNDSPYAVKEAYVSLRTKLLFSIASGSSDSCKTFAVTSPNPSEGKSITVVNTAISFAMLGKKVLLIDCDMRRPSICKLFDVSPKNGLSNLLTGVDECYVHSLEDIPLSFITAGDIPPNPSELLSSESFRGAIAELKKDYDYIFFDVPPVNAVADAQIIAPIVDAFALLVRADVTLMHEAKNAEDILQSAGAKVCGLIVNDVNLKRSSYAYKKNGKYKYRYSAQYGRDSEY